MKFLYSFFLFLVSFASISDAQQISPHQLNLNNFAAGSFFIVVWDYHTNQVAIGVGSSAKDKNNLPVYPCYKFAGGHADLTADACMNSKTCRGGGVTPKADGTLHMATASGQLNPGREVEPHLRKQMAEAIARCTNKYTTYHPY